MEKPKKPEDSFDKKSTTEESQKQKQDQQLYEPVNSLNRILNPPTITIPESLSSAMRKLIYPTSSMLTNEAIKNISETINKIYNNDSYSVFKKIAQMFNENQEALSNVRNLLEEPKYRAEKNVFNNFVKDKEKEYLKEKKEKKYEYSKGVILIADCLGTKKSWGKNNIQGYVKKIYDTRSKLEAVLKSRSDYINSKSKYEKYSDFFEIGFSCYFLSDTFVGIMKQTKKDNEKEFRKEINDAMSEQLIMLPFLFSEAIQDFFYFALENDLFIRGAISEGSLFTDEDEKVYMGPAVIDAAEVYEMAEWIGIICTTSTSFSILEKQKYLKNRIKENPENVDSYYFFDDISNYILYTVSLKQKDSSSKNIKTYLMVLDWPTYFFKKQQGDVIDLIKYFHNSHIPIKDKAKYDNTINFFEKRTDIFKQEKERNEALDFKRETDNLFYQLETRNLPERINDPIQFDNTKL